MSSLEVNDSNPYGNDVNDNSQNATGRNGGSGNNGNQHDDIEGKIFVGGLSWQTTEASLRFYFEKFGELTDAAIMIDKRTGQPRGFGFITMKDPVGMSLYIH